jgi:hypothetical protein
MGMADSRKKLKSPRRNRYGIASFLAGALALAWSAIASHAQRIRDWKDWFVLDWIDSLGLVNKIASSTPELMPYSAFVLTEGHLIGWVADAALIAAVAAVVLALLSEFKKEGTLLLAAGTFCAGLAFAMLWPKQAVVALVIPAALVLIARRLNA